MSTTADMRNTEAAGMTVSPLPASPRTKNDIRPAQIPAASIPCSFFFEKTNSLIADINRIAEISQNRPKKK
jgi:hypothetical protein